MLFLNRHRHEKRKGTALQYLLAEHAFAPCKSPNRDGIDAPIFLSNTKHQSLVYAGGVSEQLADTFLGWHRARLVCTLTLRSRCIIASYNDAFQEDYRHLSYKSISRLVCHARVKSASEFRSANLETNASKGVTRAVCLCHV
jgi:hypothetical protein